MTLPTWYKRYLYPGARGADVRALRLLLGLSAGDLYDQETSDAVVIWQKIHGGRAGGGVGPDMALALGEREGHGQCPEWWAGRKIRYGDAMWEKVEDALGYDLTVDDLKRFQGNFGLSPTGIVDEATAQVIHDFEL